MKAKVTKIENGYVYALVRRSHRPEPVDSYKVDNSGLRAGDIIEVKRVTNNPYLVRV